MMTLYGCLFIPDFPAAVLLRDEYNRMPPPVAVVTGEAPNQFIYAANQQARSGGIQPGMPLAEARARYSISSPASRLRVEHRNPEAEQRTQQELLEIALSASPNVEDSAAGLVVLDFSGLPNPHHSAAQLSYRVEKLGLEPNVAVSQNRFVALCAARTQTGLTNIFPGQEAGFLQVQSVSTLPLDGNELQTLTRWGISTIGDLAKLPEDSLVARFGARGTLMAKLSRGQQEAVLDTYEAPPELEEKQDLDWLISELEPLSFLLSGLLERLCLKLQGHNLAAAKIRVALKLADGSRFERSVALSYPLHDSRTLLTLLRLDLAAHPPGDAIEGVTVSAQPTERRLVQFSLFEPDLPSPEKLAVTLARLRNLIGPGRIGAPVVPDTHRPGAFALSEFAPVRPQRKRREQSRRKEGQDAVRESGDSHPRPRGGVDAAGSTGACDSPRFLHSLQSSVLHRSHAAARENGSEKWAPVPLRTNTPRDDTRRLKSLTPAHNASARMNGPLIVSRHPARKRAPVLSRQTLTFRCYRPPLPAEVLLRGPRPVHINSMEASGPVCAYAGPWQVSGEWWTANGWQYEEWDVEVRRRLYRIFCERPARAWYIAGSYD